MSNHNAYASSLRGERPSAERALEDGVPFFVPHLSKVKTNVMCQSKNQHLLFCFEKVGTGTVDASYRKQGNQDFYSEENLRKRQRLQDDKQVVAAIMCFWDTFPHIRQGAQWLEKRDYVDVFMKFYKALVAPHEFSMGEARQIVERDWERDVGTAASDVMTRPMFVKALFEVADIWTVGIGPDVYTSFLNKLYNRVTMTIYDKERAMWMTVWADLDKIRPFGEPKVEVSQQNQEPNATEIMSMPPKSSAAASSLAGKPPLLKKKTLSVPDGFGSPLKQTISSIADGPVGGTRRLPELQASSIANEVTRALQSVAARSPRSIRAAPTEVGRTSSRSDGAVTGDNEDDAIESSRSGGSVSSYTSSMSPKRSNHKVTTTTRKEMHGSTTNGSHKAALTDTDDAHEMPHEPVHTPDVPPQHVRLSMPSIYLSPEITPARENNKAARRRIQESMKLAQRLRRITF